MTQNCLLLNSDKTEVIFWPDWALTTKATKSPVVTLVAHIASPAVAHGRLHQKRLERPKWPKGRVFQTAGMYNNPSIHRFPLSPWIALWAAFSAYLRWKRRACCPSGSITSWETGLSTENFIGWFRSSSLMMFGSSAIGAIKHHFFFEFLCRQTGLYHTALGNQRLQWLISPPLFSSLSAFLRSFSPFFCLRNLQFAVVAPLLICIKLSFSQLSMRRSSHSHHVAHNTGCSSSPTYIEIEWQLAAAVAQMAFGVSALWALQGEIV